MEKEKKKKKKREREEGFACGRGWWEVHGPLEALNVKCMAL